MRRLVLATSNRGKLAEIRHALGGVAAELVGLDALADHVPPPQESGRTFRENARSKALAYAEATGLWALADDSGLEVSALGGRPGVHSARFAGDRATDADNNRRLLEELAGREEAERGARFVCALAVAAPGLLLAEVEADCPGRILPEPRGSGGFGYDPLFYVPELGQTFAEIPIELKARYSHRGRALAAMRERLAGVLKSSASS